MTRLLLTTLVMALTFAFGAGAGETQQCALQLTTPNPILAAGKKQTTAIKIGVTGFVPVGEKQRPPLNIALVIDRSGSMSGGKLTRAKEAAIQALRRLDSRDLAAVIVFDDQIEVLVPATKITNLDDLERKIRAINEGGSTAIYGAVKAGADEVKKFFEKGQVNRVVLLSDGQANVGPASPEELGVLGKELGGAGISVTTFGLGNGYNEDLMARLAAASDGNHKFIEGADELAGIFQKEFDTALSVVAQDVKGELTLSEGIRPVRALNMDTEIVGQKVTFGWNQIYGRHERFLMLEVEVPAGENREKRELASATLSYTNLETKATDKLSARLEISFSNSESEVSAAIIKPVMAEYVALIANLENKRAMQLRDAGDVAGARTVLGGNVKFLRENAKALNAPALEAAAASNAVQAEAAANDAEWGVKRKGMVELQNTTNAQQAY